MDNIIKSKKITPNIFYTKREENMNTLTHWIGTIIVSLGSGCLITLSVLSGSITKIVAIFMYSFSMITLYCASTLYHFAENESTKKKLKVFDHSSIYLLIAGTYTPFLLINLKGNIGTILFVVVWSMALLGITAKLFFLDKFKKLSLSVYLIMGWIIVFAIKPLINTTSITGLIFLLLGGLFYSGGVFFYVRKDKEFYHGIWHIFVLLGTVMHFFAVLYGCLLPIIGGNSWENY
ncbi:MAG: hemolysin III family protein [Dysgonamonadaceae bacterium]|jgi:hemolysin III|nr:hemolysin III family protein [Dysgonamonadaceae bacterium]